jgi:CheY-like chemotaxis protein
MGASSKRPPSYPPYVVFFDTGKDALRMDATTTPEWGDGEVLYIMAAVKDTGIGISEEEQKRLFERFNQATPRTEIVYGGSGLGLNVSRKLCHQHGGEVGVSSVEGDGITFGFFFKVRRAIAPLDDGSPSYDDLEIEKLCAGVQALSNEAARHSERTKSPGISESPPLAHVDEVAPGAASDNRFRHTSEIAHETCQAKCSTGEQKCQRSPNEVMLPGDQQVSKLDRYYKQVASSTPGSQHILVVEDNVINRKIISRKLEGLSYHVSEATNGREALKAVQCSYFDCILMDQEMPEMDGISATKAIQKLERNGGEHVPILGVTANVRAAQQTEMLEAGMDDIIHKPYRTNALFEKINQLITLVTNQGM